MSGLVKSNAKEVLRRAQGRIEKQKLKAKTKNNERIDAEIKHYETRWLFKKTMTRKEAILSLDSKDNFLVGWRTPEYTSNMDKIVLMCLESIKYGDGSVWLTTNQVGRLPRE